jgi:hypothetical protein
MAVPMTTPQVLERLGALKDQLRPFAVVTVPFPKKRKTGTDSLRSGIRLVLMTASCAAMHQGRGGETSCHAAT